MVLGTLSTLASTPVTMGELPAARERLRSRRTSESLIAAAERVGACCLRRQLGPQGFGARVSRPCAGTAEYEDDNVSPCEGFSKHEIGPSGVYFS